MRRQNNFSFTNVHFSSKAVWPKGHADDIQFYISTSESLMNVFKQLRKPLVKELDKNEVTQRLPLRENLRKHKKGHEKNKGVFFCHNCSQSSS